jgi:IS30 family transposase
VEQSRHPNGRHLHARQLGSSLDGVNQAELDDVARKLNDRPRQTLGFRTPAEKLTELIDGLNTGAPER